MSDKGLQTQNHALKSESSQNILQKGTIEMNADNLGVQRYASKPRPNTKGGMGASSRVYMNSKIDGMFNRCATIPVSHHASSMRTTAMGRGNQRQIRNPQQTPNQLLYNLNKQGALISSTFTSRKQSTITTITNSVFKPHVPGPRISEHLSMMFTPKIQKIQIAATLRSNNTS